MIITRERLEASERETLAPYACLAANSRGRIHAESESAFRTAFQKDRDRVLHTSAFRRLEYKTQVFVNFEGDYYRTRLTHTLEVAQVATSIARALGLNEDLSETIALAHDLGHPPFGHSGEKALDTLMKGDGGFDHNRQSLRIVTEIERRYPSFPGLNLTWETLEGIMKHETEYDVPDARFEPDIQPSLEAQVVNSADEVAYNVHDLDDGLRSGLLTAKQVSEVPLIGALIRSLGIDVDAFDGPSRYLLTRELLGLIITDTVVATDERLREHGIETLEDVRNASSKLLGPSARLGAQLAELKSFLYQSFYFHHRLIRMSKKANMILERMFVAYLAAPDMLPPAVRRDAEELGLKRALTDYLSGMTDRYAVEEYRRLFEPNVLT